MPAVVGKSLVSPLIKWVAAAAVTLCLLLPLIGTVHAATGEALIATPSGLVPARVVAGHDLSHPMKENYPCAGAAHSGIAIAGQMPKVACAISGNVRTASNIGPLANNQSFRCQNGVTYLQKFTNVPGFPSTQEVSQFVSQLPYAQPGPDPSHPLWFVDSSTPNLRVTVQYYWCPSTYFASGSMNYTYGTSYWTSGCGNIVLKDSAELSRSGAGVTDGENALYNICAGNYVWAYSNPGDGQFAWQAVMRIQQDFSCQEPDCRLDASVTTPVAR